MNRGNTNSRTNTKTIFASGQKKKKKKKNH